MFERGHSMFADGFENSEGGTTHVTMLGTSIVL